MSDEIIVDQNIIKQLMVIKLQLVYRVVRMLKDLRESINNVVYDCVFSSKVNEII